MHIFYEGMYTPGQMAEEKPCSVNWDAPMLSSRLTNKTIFRNALKGDIYPDLRPAPQERRGNGWPVNLPEAQRELNGTDQGQNHRQRLVQACQAAIACFEKMKDAEVIGVATPSIYEMR